LLNNQCRTLNQPLPGYGVGLHRVFAYKDVTETCLKKGVIETIRKNSQIVTAYAANNSQVLNSIKKGKNYVQKSRFSSANYV
jgi:hypothetical protein